MGWKEDAQRRVKEKSEGSTLKMQVGMNCFRVLPDKRDLEPDGRPKKAGITHPPYREFRTHRDVGPDKAFLACGMDIKGVDGDCWLCKVKIPELEASGNPRKRAAADAMAAQDQFIVQASRFDPDSQKFLAPKLFWVSTGTGGPQSLATRMYSKLAYSKKDFVDPAKGYNFNIEKTGEGMKTRYPSIEADETPMKVPLAILAAVKDIDAEIPHYDEEEMKVAYFGQAVEDDDDRPRGGKREATRAAAPRAAAAKPADDDYGDDPPVEGDGEYGADAPLDEGEDLPADEEYGDEETAAEGEEELPADEEYGADEVEELTGEDDYPDDATAAEEPEPEPARPTRRAAAPPPPARGPAAAPPATRKAPPPPARPAARKAAAPPPPPARRPAATKKAPPPPAKRGR